MINQLITAIGKTLYEEFGDGYEIHMEEIKQGLKEPCFFVQCVNPTKELFLGRRYYRTQQFCLQYFPESDHKQHECNDIAERLYECMEYIAVSSDMETENDPEMLRGTGMSHEVVDGVLNFFVNYDFFTQKPEADETMLGEMETNTTLKG